MNCLPPPRQLALPPRMHPLPLPFLRRNANELARLERWTKGQVARDGRAFPVRIGGGELLLRRIIRPRQLGVHRARPREDVRSASAWLAASVEVVESEHAQNSDAEPSQAGLEAHSD